MMFRCVTILLMVALAGCAEPPPKPLPTSTLPPASPELAASLNGTWVVVETLRDGKPYPQENGGTCEFKLPTATLTSPNGTTSQCEVRFDPTQDPKRIDWISNELGVLHGLYDLQGDTLTTCSPPLYNYRRPKRLETKTGDAHWVFKMHRQTEP